MASLSETLRAWLLQPVAAPINELQRTTTVNRAELVERLTGIDNALTALDAGVNKIGVETQALLAEVSTLAAAVAAASDTTPEIDAALEAVQARTATLAATVQAVDDLVPDAPPV
jgi:ABC-type transporter Mla subunit MlaD